MVPCLPYIYGYLIICYLSGLKIILLWVWFSFTHHLIRCQKAPSNCSDWETKGSDSSPKESDPHPQPLNQMQVKRMNLMTNCKWHLMPYLSAIKNTQTKTGRIINIWSRNMPQKPMSSDVKDLILGQLYSHKIINLLSHGLRIEYRLSWLTF